MVMIAAQGATCVILPWASTFLTFIFLFSPGRPRVVALPELHLFALTAQHFYRNQSVVVGYDLHIDAVAGPRPLAGRWLRGGLGSV